MDTGRRILHDLEQSLSEEITEGWKLYLEDCRHQGITSNVTCINKLSDRELQCLSSIAAVSTLSYISILFDRMSTDIRLDTV